MVIERVRVRRSQSLADAELVLHPLTVIIGPNVAVKGNPFDALGLLSRLASADALTRACDYHRGVRIESFQFGNQGPARSGPD